MNGQHQGKRNRSKSGCHLFLNSKGEWSWYGFDLHGDIAELCVRLTLARTIEGKT